MKYIAFIILSVCICQGCQVSKKARYDTYQNNLMFGVSYSSTASRLIPMRICQHQNDTMVFAINDLQRLKYYCYDSLTDDDFNKTIGKSLFDREKCFTSVCDSNMVFKIVAQKFKSIERLGINRIKKSYFSDDKSKTSFSDNKPSDDFLTALVILFYENYVMHWGDDEYIYIKRAPKNSKMNMIFNKAQRQ